jgi:hypothetical protein
MKSTNILLILLLLFYAYTAAAQQGINYKAIIHDDKDKPLADSEIVVQFTILENGITDVYKESHNPTTDANGILIVNIGEGTPISGDFSIIDWGSSSHFLKTEIDIGDGLADMGTVEFTTVPYAKYAEKANEAVIDHVNDADHSTSNELQSLSYDGFNLYISDGNNVRLGYPPISDTDIDQQRINWLENQLFIMNGYFLDLRDNKQYEVVKIGEQLWMNEDLDFEMDPNSCRDYPCTRFKRFDGQTLDVLEYNIEAAHFACPAGWHLPTDEDWMLLELNSGMEEDVLFNEGMRDIEYDPRPPISEDYQTLMLLIFGRTCCDAPGPIPDFSYWGSIDYEDPRDPRSRLLADYARRFEYSRGVERFLPTNNHDEYHTIRCVKDLGATYIPPRDP